MDKILISPPTHLLIGEVSEKPNFSFEPGHFQLVKTVNNTKNLIAIEKILNEKVDPPAYLAPENIGFVDEIIDADGKLRRSLLAIPTDQGYKLSFALRLAKLYLSQEGISLETSEADRTTIRLGNTELLRFFSNTGGWVQERNPTFKSLRWLALRLTQPTFGV